MIRYGIGEWFGHLFTALPIDERQQFGEIAQKTVKGANQPCPFKKVDGKLALCNKRGGMCTFRLYECKDQKTTSDCSGEKALVTMCPQRFLEDGLVHKWIGETLLGSETPQILNEFKFLMINSSNTEPEEAAQDEEAKAVGRIDTVLVVEIVDHIEWCPVEMQSVYFSGHSMTPEFKMLAESNEELPLLLKARRPDWRSSGPKRLMPQLQVKVPTIRRWGKKLALVVDKAFYDEFGEAPQANDVSNADIIWFVVDYEISANNAKLIKHSLRMTTLERSIESLVGGEPITKGDFEKQIRDKLYAGGHP